MTGWIRHILSTEQKKTDFKPEDESAPLQMYSKVSTHYFFVDVPGWEIQWVVKQYSHYTKVIAKRHRFQTEFWTIQYYIEIERQHFFRICLSQFDCTLTVRNNSANINYKNSNFHLIFTLWHSRLVRRLLNTSDATLSRSNWALTGRMWKRRCWNSA